jgi:two-component system, chemotaxis family, sensor kinase CheA
VREALAARLRAAFLDDLDEQLRVLNAELLALEAAPAAPEPMKALFRAAHTLKGAAHAASLPAVERLCHAVEEMLARGRDGALVLEPGHFAFLFAAADALAAAGERMRAGGEPDAAALDTLADAVRAGELHDLPDAGPRSDPSAPPPPRTPEPLDTTLADEAEDARPHRSATPAGTGTASSVDAGSGSVSSRASDPIPSPIPTAIPTPHSASNPTTTPHSIPTPSPSPIPTPASVGDGRVRVEAEKLDALLASVEQLLLTRARMETRLPDVEALQQEAARSLKAVRGAGGAAEAAGALRAVALGSDRLAGALTADLRALRQASDELAERVRRVRMRPFAEAFEPLPRVARDVAAASGREVRLELRGGEVEADRAVIDGVREALLHVVRNAVDHGIEPPEERQRRGKARTGTVEVAAALAGDQVVVTARDDGRGLDVAAIRAGLAARGREAPADDREAARALFEGGFSTRAAATQISGRGVGLDAARAAVERVRGTVRVEWTPGAGTTFTFEVPLTLATLPALLVRVSGAALAIPTSCVAHLSRARPEELRRAEGREVLLTDEGPVPVLPLARVLGPPLAEAGVTGAFVVVHLRVGGRRLAVAVDEPEGERELVVRPLPRGRGEVPLVGGAAILGTGEVALVLNAPAVVAAGLAMAPGGGMRVAEAPEARAARRRILVVDDSITTRTLEQSTLEAAGYEVVTAVDGEDGWRALQERGADLVVTDVEMPGMDGFALTEAIRGSHRFAALPVIVVSSLESAEHRARGMEAGADAYVGKSSFDQQGLLETIRRLLG